MDFDGVYEIRNPTATQPTFIVRLPFPAEQAVYDNANC
jgi:hypothetical protein